MWKLRAILLSLALPPLALGAPQSKGEARDKGSESSRDQRDGDGTRQTPFGRVKKDPNAAPAPEPKKPSETGLVSAEVKGDKVTFRRKTPFGNQVWTKKRSELSEDEQKIVASQSSPRNKDAAAKPKPSPPAKQAPSEEVVAKPE